MARAVIISLSEKKQIKAQRAHDLTQVVLTTKTKDPPFFYN